MIAACNVCAALFTVLGSQAQQLWAARLNAPALAPMASMTADLISMSIRLWSSLPHMTPATARLFLPWQLTSQSKVYCSNLLCPPDQNKYCTDPACETAGKCNTLECQRKSINQRQTWTCSSARIQPAQVPNRPVQL